MNKEEIIAFLKENLKIDMDVEYGSFDEDDYLTLRLLLGEEVISECGTSISSLR